jgi:HNH endonuclease
MAFSQTTKEAAYRRAGGRCECTMRTCSHHTGRCNATLRGGWHAHHKTSVAAGGDDDLGNCLAMCVTCHRNTATYGQ